MRCGHLLAIGVLVLGLLCAACVALGAGVAPTTTPASLARESPTPAATRQLPTAVAVRQIAGNIAALRPDAIPTAQVWRLTSTGGQSVYMRRTPTNGDQVRAYANGTEMQVIGADVKESGIRWRHVQAPDGITGYVPADNIAP